MMTDENALLRMRVKALEADTAALQAKVRRLEEVAEAFARQLADLRARARLAY